MKTSVFVRSAGLTFLVAASLSSAQPCGPTWIGDSPMPWPQIAANAVTVWDPDGPGPREPVVVIGGSFTGAGDVASGGLVMFDPITRRYEDFGPGAPDVAYSLAVDGEGRLIVGGGTRSGVSSVFRLDGTAWEQLPGAPRGAVRVTVLADGRLVMSGSSQQLPNGIAIWDQGELRSLENTFTVSVDGALLPMPDGGFVVGGQFGGPSANIARWTPDGGWMPIGSGLNGTVRSLVRLPDGRIVASGNFTAAGNTTARGIAVWDGATWSELGGGLWRVLSASVAMPSSADALAVDRDGSLLVSGGIQRAGDVPVSGVARWNGVSWSRVGSEFGSGFAGSPNSTRLAPMPDGRILITGNIDFAGFRRASTFGAQRGFAFLFEGTRWTPAGPGFDAADLVTATSADGRVFAAGSFTQTPSGPADGLALWDGVRWTALGARPTMNSATLDARIRAAVSLPNGDFVVGGFFRSIGGVAANNIARWDGQRWWPLADGVNNEVFALAVLPSGELLVSGTFTAAGTLSADRLAVWTGEAWSRLGSAATPGLFFRLLATPDGRIFGLGQGLLQQWDGAAWVQLVNANRAGLNGEVDAMTLLPNGNIGFAGNFTRSESTPLPYAAQWDGQRFLPLGTNLTSRATSLLVKRTGDVLISSATNIADINGPRYLFRLGAGVWEGVMTPSPGRTGNAVNLPADEFSYASNGGEDYGGRWAWALTRASLTNAPWAARHPEASASAIGRTVTLSATPAVGYRNVSYRWLRDGQPIANGPGGASEFGGTVTGAAGTLSDATTATDGTPAVLTLSNLQPGDEGRYTCEFFNACGRDESRPAQVSIPCPADLDGSGFVDGDDVALFFELFARGCVGPGAGAVGADGTCATTADVDRSGFVDADDVVMFLDAMGRGC